MFSTNPYTRRRQQVVAAVTAASGILGALGIVTLNRAQSAPRFVPTTVAVAAPPVASPDGRFQAEIEGDKIVLREKELPVMVLTPLREYQSALNSIKSVTFSADKTPALLVTLRIATRTAEGNYVVQDRLQKTSLALLYSDKLAQLHAH